METIGSNHCFESTKGVRQEVQKGLLQSKTIVRMTDMLKP